MLLLLMTLAVLGGAAYLVANPPGVLDPASQQAALPTTTTAPATTLPPGAPVPPVVDPGEVPGQLSLGTACGAVLPLLTRTDDVRTTAIENIDALDSETISDLTRDLESLGGVSPAELDAFIDPLTQVLVELNNEILAGAENPELDTEIAEGSSDSIRALCESA
ncbi:MAG: hypothetical protein M3400_09140 [Actinomycetota bacterium]|nr:hypothetical protein [Actinomycetota bacterium]